jgi:hypothetical protein
VLSVLAPHDHPHINQIRALPRQTSLNKLCPHATASAPASRHLDLLPAVFRVEEMEPLEAAARLPGRERKDAAGLLSRYRDDVRV